MGTPDKGGSAIEVGVEFEGAYIPEGGTRAVTEEVYNP